VVESETGRPDFFSTVSPASRRVALQPYLSRCFLREARHGSHRAGSWLVQLRYKTDLTSTEYVNRQAWREASLAACPLHPHGGCGFARHGYYERVKPPGCRIARWYCRLGHQTFSLLPDCLAARWSGSLAEIEAAVDVVEKAPSLEAATATMRLEIELPGVLRWLHRRAQTIHTTLVLLKGLVPAYFVNTAPTLAAFRHTLDVEVVLVLLRETAADFLPALPPPLGFRPPVVNDNANDNARQQRAGPDPPTSDV